MIRPAAVAGYFYEANPERLRAQIDSCLPASRPGDEQWIGAVAPHAGYMYSGPVAGELYSRLELPRRFVILCPNHTGLGAPAAISRSGAWRTPLGDAPVDAELATAIVNGFPALSDDPLAHAREHALEVQLPFLQVLAPGFRFVPICLGPLSHATCEALGAAIAAAVAASSEPVGIIASSDLNHYEDQKTTLAKDQLAIDRVLALDAAGLHDTAAHRGVSMCGYVPATAMLAAARHLGATEARLLRHATSGDVSGDYERVVGYAAIAVGAGGRYPEQKKEEVH